MPKNLHPKLKKWINGLEIIKGEVQELVIAKDMFQQVQKMIEDNPLLHRPSLFYRHFSNTYVSHVVIGLRPQIKSGDQSISMSRSLKK